MPCFPAGENQADIAFISDGAGRIDMHLDRAEQCGKNVFLDRNRLYTIGRYVRRAFYEPSVPQVNAFRVVPVDDTAVFPGSGEDKQQNEQDVHTEGRDCFRKCLRLEKQVLQKRDNQQVCKPGEIGKDGIRVCPEVGFLFSAYIFILRHGNPPFPLYSLCF